MRIVNFTKLVMAGLVCSVGLGVSQAQTQPVIPGNASGFAPQATWGQQAAPQAAAPVSRPQSMPVAPRSGGVIPLPQGINQVFSIDAHNIVVLDTQGADGGRVYRVIVPQHVYSGGIARTFGGTVIPTEVLVVPESARMRSQGRNNGGFASVRNNGPFQSISPFSGTIPATGTGTISGGGQNWTPIQ